VRRIHYVLVSTEVFDVAGNRYVNNLNFWNDLKSAGRDARYLGFIPLDAIVDHRSDDAVVHLACHNRELEFGIEEPRRLFVPESGQKLSVVRIEPLSPHLLMSSPPPTLPQYQFSPAVVSQRFHVEIWSEKTSVADILLPLARTYGLNIVMGAGDMSLTRCLQFVERAVASDRPVRILYVSDFDPQGHNMPVGVARKIDFYNRTRNLNLDVRVFPVALTHEQCVEYQLPRIPLKETVRARGKFEERFGEGATELDALEALRPGLLQQILVANIERYYDASLDERAREAVGTFGQQLNDVHSAIMERHRPELDSLRQQQNEVDERCKSALRPILNRCNRAIRRCNAKLLAALRRCNFKASSAIEQHLVSIQEIADRYLAVHRAVASELADEAPDPDQFDWPEGKEGEEPENCLFDSLRDYVEQIDRFKTYQGKPTARVVRSDKGKKFKRVLAPRGEASESEPGEGDEQEPPLPAAGGA
jgi:hypothetical protein